MHETNIKGFVFHCKSLSKKGAVSITFSINASYFRLYLNSKFP